MDACMHACCHTRNIHGTIVQQWTHLEVQATAQEAQAISAVGVIIIHLSGWSLTWDCTNNTIKYWKQLPMAVYTIAYLTWSCTVTANLFGTCDVTANLFGTCGMVSDDKKNNKILIERP